MRSVSIHFDREMYGHIGSIAEFDELFAMPHPVMVSSEWNS